MADLLAAGKAVLAQFVSTLPEDLRGPAQEMFSKAEAQAAIEKIGDSALMRQDYSRNMDAVAQEKARVDTEKAAVETWRKNLSDWHAGVKDLAVLGEAAKKSGWTPETDDTAARTPLQSPKPADLPADLVRAADLDSRERLAVSYMNAATNLGLKHYQAFGEILDMDSLIGDPRAATLGIMGVYNAKYKDRYDEKVKAASDADRAKFEAEIRADERRKSANRPLTPVGNDLSPLDALADPNKKPGTASVEDMAAEYERLVALKAG